MTTIVPNKKNAEALRRDIAHIAGIEGDVTIHALKARAKLDGGVIPSDLLAVGPQGQEHYLFNTWLELFVSNPSVAYGLQPQAIDYFEWGNRNRRNKIKSLFVRAKHRTVRPQQRIDEPSGPDVHFISLLQFVINKSGLFDYEAASILKINKSHLSDLFRGLHSLPQEQVEGIISTLEVDLTGPKKVSAYSEYREQILKFAAPPPPEGCCFGDLLKHVIIKSNMPYTTAARLLEISRRTLTGILYESVKYSRIQKIVAILEMDCDGERKFSAYKTYRERFRGFIPDAKTFEELVGYVVTESGLTARAASEIFGTSSDRLTKIIAGDRMRPLTKQIVFDHLEKDFRRDKIFVAYEKYRPQILRIRNTRANEEAFYIILGRTIVESHRTIAYAAKHFGMPSSTLIAHIRGTNPFSRETAQMIVASLEVDHMAGKDFSAYSKHWSTLTRLASGLKTKKEIREDGWSKRRALSVAKKGPPSLR